MFMVQIILTGLGIFHDFLSNEAWSQELLGYLGY